MNKYRAVVMSHANWGGQAFFLFMVSKQTTGWLLRDRDHHNILFDSNLFWKCKNASFKPPFIPSDDSELLFCPFKRKADKLPENKYLTRWFLLPELAQMMTFSPQSTTEKGCCFHWIQNFGHDERRPKNPETPSLVTYRVANAYPLNAFKTSKVLRGKILEL